jgi:hypothetical protein
MVSFVSAKVKAGDFGFRRSASKDAMGSERQKVQVWKERPGMEAQGEVQKPSAAWANKRRKRGAECAQNRALILAIEADNLLKTEGRQK